MRDIRFRAWDNKEEWMVDDMLLSFDGEILTDDVQPHDTPYKEIELADEGRYELMQYTGLKDKNGAEIYEGDIVKRTYLFDGAFGKTHVGEVVYDKESARYVISKPNNFIEPKTEDLGNTLSYRSTYEVIGNIHENKELLEE